MTAPPVDAPRSSLWHGAGFYHHGDHLMGQLAPFLEAALSRGDEVAVGLQADTEDRLVRELGPLPGVRRLPRPEDRSRTSAQTVATRLGRILEDLSAGYRPVTAITQYDERLGGRDGRFWVELEAACNLALTTLPLRLLCFFPSRPDRPEVREGALGNHPFLLCHQREPRSNPRFAAPASVLVRTGLSAPDPLTPPPDQEIDFDVGGLAEVRSLVRRAIGRAGLSQARAEDAVVAVNEVATNAVEHGSTHARLCLWHRPDQVTLEIHDGGSLTTPLPGMARPGPDQCRGWGLWTARRILDYLHIWSDDRGTHVRMEL